MKVQVIQAWPHGFESRDIALPDGATVAEAIATSGLAPPATGGHAVFGERVGIDHALRDGDRLELLRPLQADPKESRRRRANAQVARRD